jgi:DNA-binding NarL/FixJ family response regulator
MKDAIRIILFEDNEDFRESLDFHFDGSNTIYLVASYPKATNALAHIRRHEPDVVLMDIEMPEISGIEALQQIKKVEKKTKILMQTSFKDDHKIFAALCAGASGYVLKSAGLEATENAIYAVHAGGGYFTPSIASKVISFFQNDLVTNQVEYVELTPTEKKVLECMGEGLSYKMIEDRLNKNYHAVHFHIRNIYKKLHVNSMTEAVVKAIKNHLI